MAGKRAQYAAANARGTDGKLLRAAPFAPEPTAHLAPANRRERIPSRRLSSVAPSAVRTVKDS